MGPCATRHAVLRNDATCWDESGHVSSCQGRYNRNVWKSSSRLAGPLCSLPPSATNPSGWKTDHTTYAKKSRTPQRLKVDDHCSRRPLLEREENVLIDEFSEDDVLINETVDGLDERGTRFHLKLPVATSRRGTGSGMHSAWGQMTRSICGMN